MSSDPVDTITRVARAVLATGTFSQDTADAFNFVLHAAARMGRESGSAPATPAYVENMGKRWEKATPKKKTRTRVTRSQESVPMKQEQELKSTSKSRVRVRSRADDHTDVTRLHAEYAKQIAKVVQETEDRVRAEERATQAMMYESLRRNGGYGHDFSPIHGGRVPPVRSASEVAVENDLSYRSRVFQELSNQLSSPGVLTGRFDGTDGNPHGMVSMSYDASFALDLDVVTRSVVFAATVRRVANYQFSPRQQTYSCVMRIPQEQIEDGARWVDEVMTRMASQLMAVVDLTFFLHRFVQFLAATILRDDDYNNRNPRRSLGRLGNITASTLTEARDAVLRSFIPEGGNDRNPYPR